MFYGEVILQKTESPAKNHRQWFTQVNSPTMRLLVSSPSHTQFIGHSVTIIPCRFHPVPDPRSAIPPRARGSFMLMGHIFHEPHQFLVPIPFKHGSCKSCRQDDILLGEDSPTFGLVEAQDSKALDSKPQVDYWYWLINMMAAKRSKKMFRCVKQSIEMG